MIKCITVVSNGRHVGDLSIWIAAPCPLDQSFIIAICLRQHHNNERLRKDRDQYLY